MGRHLALLVIGALILAGGVLGTAEALSNTDPEPVLDEVPANVGASLRADEVSFSARANPAPGVEAELDASLEGQTGEATLRQQASAGGQEAAYHVEEVLPAAQLVEAFPHVDEIGLAPGEIPHQVGLVLPDPGDGQAEETRSDKHVVTTERASSSSTNAWAGQALLVVMPVAAATLTGTAYATGATTWLRRVLPGLPLTPFYSRISRQELLEHEARARIHEVLKQTPGLCIREIADRLEASRSTTRHHVRILKDAGVVDTATVGRCKVHYLVGDEQAAIQRHVLKNENRAQIAEVIDDGERSVSEIAELLDVNVGSVHFHLSKLCEVGLATRRENGRVTYQLERDGADGSS